MSDNDGRRVLDVMVKAGVSPDEVTLTTLLKVGATFNEGCELAVFARDDRVGSLTEASTTIIDFRNGHDCVDKVSRTETGCKI